MLKLTPRQQEILDYIRNNVEMLGAPPTRAEIASAFGFASHNAAEEHLKALAKKGAIVLEPGSARGIRLVEQLGGKATPACGFAMGVERLVTLIRESGGEPEIPGPDVYVVHQGDAASRMAPRVAEGLRDQGIDVLFHCGGGGFKSQMKKADASGATFAIIIGDDEANPRTHN